MRRSIDGLSMLVQSQISGEQGYGTVFVFINKGGDKIKILLKQHNGFCLLYKRLDRKRFQIKVGLISRTDVAGKVPVACGIKPYQTETQMAARRPRLGKIIMC